MEATKTKKKKPFGFYVCALGFTFERMAFYTAKYLFSYMDSNRSSIWWIRITR